MVVYFSGLKNTNNSKLNTEIEAKEIAEEFFCENVSANGLQDYVYEGTRDLVDDMYTFQYSKYIEGYATDDTMQITVASEGYVYAYVNYSYKKYDSLEDSITKEGLEKAKVTLDELIKEAELPNYEVERMEITTNTSGEVYMRARIFYGEDRTRLIQLYASVEN